MRIEDYLLLILSVITSFILAFWLGVYYDRKRQRPKLTYWEKVAKKGEESLEIEDGIEAYISESEKAVRSVAESASFKAGALPVRFTQIPFM